MVLTALAHSPSVVGRVCDDLSTNMAAAALRGIDPRACVPRGNTRGRVMTVDRYGCSCGGGVATVAGGLLRIGRERSATPEHVLEPRDGNPLAAGTRRTALGALQRRARAGCRVVLSHDLLLL